VKKSPTPAKPNNTKKKKHVGVLGATTSKNLPFTTRVKPPQVASIGQPAVYTAPSKANQERIPQNRRSARALGFN